MDSAKPLERVQYVNVGPNNQATLEMLSQLIEAHLDHAFVAQKLNAPVFVRSRFCSVYH